MSSAYDVPKSLTTIIGLHDKVGLVIHTFFALIELVSHEEHVQNNRRGVLSRAFRSSKHEAFTQCWFNAGPAL